jgi:hypothetical protein
MLIKGALHQKEITIVNVYVPTIGAHNFIKHALLDLKYTDGHQHSDSWRF